MTASARSLADLAARRATREADELRADVKAVTEHRDVVQAELTCARAALADLVAVLRSQGGFLPVTHQHALWAAEALLGAAGPGVRAGTPPAGEAKP